MKLEYKKVSREQNKLNKNSVNRNAMFTWKNEIDGGKPL